MRCPQTSASVARAVLPACVGAGLVACFCALLVAVAPGYAHAVTKGELFTLQQDVERATTTYNEAQQSLEELNGLIAENEAKLADIAQNLQGQKERSAQAMKGLYVLKQQDFGLIDAVAGSQTLTEFLDNVTYIERVQKLHSEEIEKYANMQAEYESVSADLATRKEQAEQEQARAEQALADAQQAHQAAQEAARREAEEQARKVRENQASDGTSAELTALDSEVDWTLDRETFISTWAARIDAYLAGSPMAGTGRTFAEASWDYGVDPRWSPAISFIESSRGTAIPYGNSYNAWGWTAASGGFRTFSNWNEAARLHVEYLAHMYGYTITPAHAAKYCPPNANAWYRIVLTQMRAI